MICVTTGLEHCVDCSKSVVLSVALFEGRLDAEEAANLALLETRHQVGKYRPTYEPVRMMKGGGGRGGEMCEVL